MPRFKALLLLIVGSLLLFLSLTVEVENPVVGILTGSLMVLVGLCVLVRKPKYQPDETDKAGC